MRKLTIRKKSQNQEKRTAQQLKGRTQLASGAINAVGLKADVRTDKYLVENKFTDTDFYQFSVKVWEKVAVESAKDGGRIPLLQVDLQDLKLMILYDGDCVIPALSECELIEVSSTKNLKRSSIEQIFNDHKDLKLKYSNPVTKKIKYLRVVKLDQFLLYED